MTATTKYNINTEPRTESEVACVKCAGKTSHKVLASVDESGSDGSGAYDWHNGHQIIQCEGCKSLSYRIVSSNSEEYFFDENEQCHYIETEKLYPPRLEGRRSLGDETIYLPHEVRQIYDETSIALAVQAPILAAVGLRSLIEQVCKEKKAEGGDLFKRIEDLVEKRVLTPVSAAILHKIRTLGNAAAHEVKPHTERQLSLAMDIVEHLLKDVYILPKQAENEF